MGLDDVLRRPWRESLLTRARIPRFFLGLLGMILIALLLGVFGLLTQWLLASILFVFALLAIPGCLTGLRQLRDTLRDKSIWPEAALWLLVLFLLAGNMLRALQPHGFVDPLIVYAVRPDRWLASGAIVPIAQSKFIGFPFVGELLALWPAALSAGRTEQLVLLQLFQSSMLAAAAFTAASLMRLDGRHSPVAAASILGLPILASWSSVAKTDMTAIYFMTVALSLLLFDLVKGRGGNASLTAWAACGIAMGVKYTVLPAAGVLLVGALLLPGWRRRIAGGLAVAAVVPVGFALRNTLLTGSPLYPYLTGTLSGGSKWELVYPEAVQQIRLRPGRPFIPSLLSLLASWRSAGILFALGIWGLCARGRLRAAAAISVVVLAYALTCSLVFNPMPWGAKYAILIIPALACLGASCMIWTKLSASVLAAGVTAAILLLSEVPERAALLGRGPTLLEDVSFRGSDIPPTLGLHRWINENLPPDVRLLSLWRPERYFCDRDIVVAQNSPLGLGLFSPRTGPQEEMAIMREMCIDYVYFAAADPLPSELERDLAILSTDARNRLLVPVVEYDGYLICRLNYEAADAERVR